MKSKTQDKFIWGILLAILMTSVILLGRSCSSNVKNFDEKHNIIRLSTGQRIYEVEYKGTTYIVVETHQGIGICQKADAPFDTNLFNRSLDIKTK